jgi:methyl-accepting chemotaxis protein
MAARRRVARKTKAPQFGSAADAARAQAVVLEQIRSQMDVVLEAVVGSRAHLDAKIDAVGARLSARIAVLEEVVRKNSEDIRKNSEDIRKNSEDIRKNSEDIRKNSEDIKRNSEDIRQLREEIARLRYDFDHRAEVGGLGMLEGRVTALEQRVGVAR